MKLDELIAPYLEKIWCENKQEAKNKGTGMFLLWTHSFINGVEIYQA